MGAGRASACCRASRGMRAVSRRCAPPCAAASIAGIVSDKGNVLGMMPHPENHVEDIMGNTDGRGLFAGLVAHLESAA